MKRRTIYFTAAAMAFSAFAGVSIAGKHGHDRGQYFNKMDTDGSGGISQAEIDAVRLKRFSRMDADGNGHVTLEEVQAAGVEKANKRAERHFKRMDANGDGLVTADELDNRMGKHFDKADADGNGEISRDEMRAAHEQMRKHRKGGHHKSKTE